MPEPVPSDAAPSSEVDGASPPGGGGASASVPVVSVPVLSPSVPVPVPPVSLPSPSFRVRVGVGAAVVLVVAALVVSVLVTALTPVGATTVVTDARPGAPGSSAAAPATAGAPPAGSGASAPPAVSDPSAVSTSDPAPPGSPLLVHVLGAVVAPGVYELAEGSRVVDAVAAAGGLTPTADAASVNLARQLTDGEQLRVLAVGEAPPPPVPGSVPAAGGAGPSSGSGSGGGPAAAPINLNAATEIDLDTLPRIGPAMAARIVAYRDANGPFASIDDLLQVPGIGDKTLESLRPLLTL